MDQEESDLRTSTRLAETLAQQGVWDNRALRVNQHVLELDARNIGARTRLAKYHLNAGNVDEAGRLYEETLRLDPNNTIAHNALDRLARELESDSDAELMETSHAARSRRHGVGPRRYPTPNDIEAARRYFEALYPHEGNRRLALTAMVETIRQIDRVNMLALGLTVRPIWSRLNVGRAGWGFFRPTEIELIVDERTLHRLTVEQQERVNPGRADYAALRSLPHHPFHFARVPLDRLDDIYPLLNESHFWVVRALAQQVSRTPYYKSHSSGATAYMQEFLGINVPDPEH